LPVGLITGFAFSEELEAKIWQSLFDEAMENLSIPRYSKK